MFILKDLESNWFKIFDYINVIERQIIGNNYDLRPVVSLDFESFSVAQTYESIWYR